MKETAHPRISISFDDKKILIELDPSNGGKTVKKITWEKIMDICYKSYDYGAPNFLYITLQDEEEKCIIPITERGGKEFWEEVKHRGLFDQKMALIVEASWNRIFFWPD